MCFTCTCPSVRWHTNSLNKAGEGMQVALSNEDCSSHLVRSHVSSLKNDLYYEDDCEYKNTKPGILGLLRNI